MIQIWQPPSQYHSPEFKLLAELTKPDRAQVADRVRGSLDGIDWSSLKELAGFHRVEGLAARGIRAHAEMFPASIVEHFSQRMTAGAMLSLRIQDLQRRIFNAFAHSSVEAILLKGHSIAAFHYAERTERLSKDIDVLVDFPQLENAVNVLEAMDIKQVKPTFPIADVALTCPPGNRAI